MTDACPACGYRDRTEYRPLSPEDERARWLLMALEVWALGYTALALAYGRNADSPPKGRMMRRHGPDVTLGV